MAVGTAAINTEASLIANGHRLAADLEFAKPYQRIVWERDDLPALTDAFAMMEEVSLFRSAVCGTNPASSA